MRLMHYALWILVLFFVATTRDAFAFNQVEPYFESVGDAETIPDNNVSALAQDKVGFLWIGTPDGLIRYDGYRFRAYRSTNNDALGSGSDFVRSMLVARDGRLWVGTNADGVSVVEPISGAIERIRASNSQLPGLSNATVRALAEDKRGAIWIGTREGLDYWEPRTGQIRQHRQRLGSSTSAADEHITALMVDAQGVLWVGSLGGLSFRRSPDDAFSRFEASDENSPNLHDEQVQSLLELSNGSIIIGTARSGSFALDPRRAELQHIPVGTDTKAIQPAVMSLLEPKPGLLWLGVFGGIDVVDTKNMRLLRQIRPDPSVVSSLAHDQVRTMLRDHSGQVWVGGYGGGLQRHDPGNEAIAVLRHSPSRADSLSSPSISSVLELRDGNIWVGTRGNGVDVWNRTRGVIAGYRPAPDDPKSLRNGVISSLAQTANGTIFVGSIDGLHRFDAQTQSFAHFGVEQGLPDVYVRKLLASPAGELWIGTDAGLAWLASDGIVHSVTATDGANLRIDINALELAPDGQVWVGSSAGLYAVAPNTRTLSAKALNLADGTGLGQLSMLGLLVDHTGQLWADTPVGLYRVRMSGPDAVVLEPVSSRLGKTGQPFGANLLEDQQGRIWSQGFVYDPRADSLYELGRADGADFGTAWFRAYTKTSDQMLLFGGSKGLMVVDPTRFRRWDFKPQLVVTEAKVGSELVVLNLAGEGFSVSPEQRGFSVEFSALDFTAPQLNRYEYQLEGFDSQWVATDASRRVASYNSLSPGSYVLRIRGSGRTGNMSPHELAIPVRIIPAYWQTWWFMCAVFGILVAASIIILRLNARRIRHRAEQLERIVAQRTGELTLAKEGAEVALEQLRSAQIELVAREKMASLGQLVAGVAHEINTPLGVALTASSYLNERSEELRRTLESGRMQRSELAAFMDSTREASGIIHQNLARAAELVRSFKQVSVDRSSDDRRHFNLRDSLRAVVSSMELTWKRRPISLELDCDDLIELDSFPGALGQVMTNMIQNALLHAFDDLRAGNMRISASLSNEQNVKISFEDNGNGIGAGELARIFEPFYTTRRSQGGSGLGLHIVYNLVTVKLGGRIEAHSEPGIGMRFVLTVPLRAP